MDGVGLGELDPTVNPFATAHLPALTGLLGDGWWHHKNGRLSTHRATLIPTDATLGVQGRPQSATGQATILTGRNVPRLIGEHYGPKPNTAVAEQIHRGTLFHELKVAGHSAALITPYPPPFFKAVDRGKRLLSSVPLSVTSAGFELMTADDLHQGRAVSPGFTGEAWRDQLGYPDMPVMSLAEAGAQIGRIARTHRFSFFEHWPSDRAGHRGTLAEAVAHLELIDGALAGLFETWDDENGLLIITSDHGNIEDKSHRSHTLNPVPTILLGRNHAQLAARVENLTHIAPIVRDTIQLPHPSAAE